jgi:hypothetical protein
MVNIFLSIVYNSEVQCRIKKSGDENKEQREKRHKAQGTAQEREKAQGTRHKKGPRSKEE